MNKIYASYVGIENYSVANYKVDGPVDSITEMKNFLEIKGAETIESLFNELATKKNLLALIDKTISSLKSGDLGIICLSGHGAKKQDVNGDESSLFDSVFLSYNANEYIVDDDVYVATKKMAKGARLVIIIDSCHSEGFEKLVRLDKSEKSEKSENSSRESKKLGGFFGGIWDWIKKMFTPENFDPIDGVICLAACQQDQKAKTTWTNGRAGTVFLESLIYCAKENDELSWEELIDNITYDIQGVCFDQTPQLTGDSKMFSQIAFKV